jgi:hypothetical protein
MEPYILVRDLFSSLGKVLPTLLLSESYLAATYVHSLHVGKYNLGI